MKAVPPALLLLLLACGPPTRAQQAARAPHIGYLYPAGGRQGTVLHVIVGGQALRGTTDVYLTGTGVQARVLEVYPPWRNISDEERATLSNTMRALIAQRWAEWHAAGRVGGAPPWRTLPLPGRGRNRDRTRATEADSAALPRHPLLHDLERKDLPELLHVGHMLRNARQGQPNTQLAESVLLEVRIDHEAEPGDHELRLGGRAGLTNPLVFMVGTLPEILELENNDPAAPRVLPNSPPFELPFVLNGQILPGDVDRFRFRAPAGHRLVVQTHARRLVPFLADAVPGWFEATVTLYDAEGRELAFADSFRFDPDPVLCYEIPADGTYTLEVRDALYRGREDFVYRIQVGPLPFITAVYPLGTTPGHQRYVAIEGWNLTTRRLHLDPTPHGAGIQHRHLALGQRLSNRVAYAVDPWRAVLETEPNDTLADAQRVTLPRIVDGRIDRPGDVDVYQFKGKAGEELVAEVTARRLNSPLDSLLRLTDAAGNVLAWNDDHEHKDGFLHPALGLHTHSADSRLGLRLPADGIYCVQVADTQGQGGPGYAYRLRVGPPRPDVALRATPSSLNVPAGGAAPLAVYALRQDGFSGEIEVVLKDAPRGFRLSGATIPAGRDHVRMTLLAPRRRLAAPVVLHLEGRARIGAGTVTRPVVPADDMMQAFLYRHLTPAQALLVAVVSGRLPAGEITIEPTPVRIPAGDTASVAVTLPRALLAQHAGLELELNAPPAGVTLEHTTPRPDGLALLLKADAAVLAPGFADNLIVEGFVTVDRRPSGAEGGGQKVRVSAGFLPAIPCVIVPPRDPTTLD